MISAILAWAYTHQLRAAAVEVAYLFSLRLGLFPVFPGALALLALPTCLNEVHDGFGVCHDADDVC
jgi:hypothetical protein